MSRTFASLLIAGILFSSMQTTQAQVYSPKVLTEGQVDTTNLKQLAQDIYRNAHAATDREKAEAIWRFYLTDGRFVKPGMIYHIPGWAYEEPLGEVLDPIKLINSYGFGLCYQIAPLLQATWEAGGFKHTRVWFLTGHTVAEVFYGGQYHYYDSDMMGYTTIGNGPVKTSPVASVQQLESDKEILLGKLEDPKKVRFGAVDQPWYNADVRAGAIDDLANLFATTNDNYLFGYTRYPHGHTMDFVLRPGERMIRFYTQPDAMDRYLPYTSDGQRWREFPRDWGPSLLVSNGPKSEKDSRRWSTGLLEYRPDLQRRDTAIGDRITATEAVFSVTSPYVIIGANFSFHVLLSSAEQPFRIETSTDMGHTWTAASTLPGSASESRSAEPATLTTSDHGKLNAVAGSYSYLVKISGSAGENLTRALKDLVLTTSFQFNPRTLPVITAGRNELRFVSSTEMRQELAITAATAQSFAQTTRNINLSAHAGQDLLRNTSDSPGEMIFKLSAQGPRISGFDLGGRFLDLRDGLAPDKLTAEVRKVSPWPEKPGTLQAASIAWSLTPAGPWTTVWSYDPHVKWPDGQTIRRTLHWPEVDRSVRDLNISSRTVYVRYRLQNLAVDAIRLATIEPAPQHGGKLEITHIWLQDGRPAQHTEVISGQREKSYTFDVPEAGQIVNQALILSAR